MSKGHKNWLEEAPAGQVWHNLNIKITIMNYNPMNKNLRVYTDRNGEGRALLSRRVPTNKEWQEIIFYKRIGLNSLKMLRSNMIKAEDIFQTKRGLKQHGN